MTEPLPDVTRRQLLRLCGVGGMTLVGAGWLTACASDEALPPSSAGTSSPAGAPSGQAGSASFAGYGRLGAPDANGLRLPEGFSSRVIATTGEEVAGTGYVWPPNPDGGAVFAADDGGWIYVVNSEALPPDGSVSMVRFDPDGEIVEARRILEGTAMNCAGGATPWGTWLSCEELPEGLVYECDPTGATPGQVRPAMGAFMHEAAAVDPAGQAVYLTEDHPTGALYRFVPDTYPDLSAGVLEVLVEDGSSLAWEPVPDPSASSGPTQDQVPGTRRFNGGEGICFHDGSVFFTTKGDDHVWRYDIEANEVSVVYAGSSSGDPLAGVDNITVTPTGDLYVAEDGDDMQVVLVGSGLVEPVVEITGVENSEVTGPAFTPDGSRLYFSSQRFPGRTYEVTGPWRFES